MSSIAIDAYAFPTCCMALAFSQNKFSNLFLENVVTFYRYIAAMHLSLITRQQLRAGQPVSGWSGLCDVTTDGRRQSIEQRKQTTLIHSEYRTPWFTRLGMEQNCHVVVYLLF